jgi:hypothetical protein
MSLKSNMESTDLRALARKQNTQYSLFIMITNRPYFL